MPEFLCSGARCRDIALNFALGTRCTGMSSPTGDGRKNLSFLEIRSYPDHTTAMSGT
jgi:hypothetical protein